MATAQRTPYQQLSILKTPTRNLPIQNLLIPTLNSTIKTITCLKSTLALHLLNDLKVSCTNPLVLVPHA